MNAVYIITGGNLGNRLNNLKKAEQILENEVGQILKSSAIYETSAWGNADQPDFYNQVHLLETGLSPEDLMQKILKIEEQMGRVRTIKNAARLIDIDILFYDDIVISKPGLIIPHAEIANRRFVLEPLNEINPRLVHPRLKKTPEELLTLCKDPLKVRRLNSL